MTRQRVPVGVALPARNRRDQEEDDRERDERKRDQAGLAVEAPRAAEEQRKAQDEEQIPDDAAGERAAHDLGESLVDGDQGDDQLGRVPERRVEEAADAGSGVV